MSVYLVTGRLGSGKSLASVERAIEYASKGRRVVANFHLDLAPITVSRKEKISDQVVEVIPSRPSSKDLKGLGRGGKSEHDAGLLILDECSLFLNSRHWNDKDRHEVLDWFVHSRKLGWDVLLITQHQNQIDKQVRESVCEYLVVCKRMDKLSLPVINWFFKGVTLPRVHIAFVRYGLEPTAPIAERWIYRGNGWFKCYSTEWISQAEMIGGYYSVLPARLSKWRYIPLPPSLPVRLALGLLKGLWWVTTCLDRPPVPEPQGASDWEPPKLPPSLQTRRLVRVEPTFKAAPHTRALRGTRTLVRGESAKAA